MSVKSVTFLADCEEIEKYGLTLFQGVGYYSGIFTLYFFKKKYNT